MFCTNCGNQIPDEALFCPHCGTKCGSPAEEVLRAEPIQPDVQPVVHPDPQPAWQQAAPDQQSWQTPKPMEQPAPEQQSWGEPQPVEVRKRSPKKGILIGVGCAALAALIGGGIWFLSRGGDPAKKLKQAAENSLKDLKAYTESLPNLHTIVEDVEKLSGAEAMHMGFESTNTLHFGSGEQEQTIEMGVKLNGDADKGKKQAMVTGTYSAQGTEIPFSIYLDETQLQAASSALLEEGEAVSVPLQDLPKQWNASALAKLTEFQLPEDLDLSNLKEADLEAGLKNAYGEDWTTFAQSVEVIRYEGTPHFSDKGTTYSLSWDHDALKRMADKTGEVDMDKLIDIQDFEDLQKLDLSDVGAKAVIYLLGQIDEHVKDLQFFVANDKLVGVYMSTDDEDGSEELELRLSGEKNPWEHLRCSYTKNEQDNRTVEAVDVTLQNANGQLRLEVNTSHEDSDGEEYNWEDGPYTLIYNDADGRIRYEEDGEDLTGNVDLRLVPAEGGFRFSFETGYESDSYSMKNLMAFSVSSKLGSIAPLSAQPIDLLKLSEQELQALILRIQEKLQALEN